MPVFLNGLVLGISLIMSLGPQNIFLIRQGAQRQHAALSALVCFCCDAILVTLSVAGLHQVLLHHPNVTYWLIWFGVAFLLVYGSISLKSALKPLPRTLNNNPNRATRRQIIALALGFSLLNPQAIVESLILIGGGSGQYPEHPNLFLLGVITSSFIWFAILTLMAYFFAAKLTQAKVWRRVEFASGTLMVYIALKLVLSSSV